jgi:hypothetical protein
MRRLALFMLAGLCTAGGARAQAPAWSGFAGDAQHTARAPARPQPLSRIRWSVKVDLSPQLVGGDLPIHYGSPMISGANTVLVPVKTGANGGWRIAAYGGGTGTPRWILPTDYVLPPHDWIPPLPAVLTPQNRLFVAGVGGTLIQRNNPNIAGGSTVRRVFYGAAEWQAHRAAYDAAVAVSTPITADAAGNLYFGFAVSAATPAKLVSGIARISADGEGSWISAATTARDTGITHVAMNCAPALSQDGKTVYVAVSNGSAGYLVGLDTATLAPKYRARLLDPSTGWPAWLNDDSTASPTVGPDGDVYCGVQEEPYPQHDGRGWLLHYDGKLETLKTPGSFGWDATVSIVPKAAVPSYKGQSTYLLASKYNNYLGLGPHGDGRNRFAVLDPHAAQIDAYSSVRVMREVETILSPVHVPGAPAGATYEWCITAAVVDATTSSVIINNAAGKAYRWDLANNTLAEMLTLNKPRSEAYTPTLIGPDGTVYAINNSTLYAIGK